ncbi:hypothetical protein MKEN_00855800 [Mycena kentingensis (nom. inval.)]|nr:hypothetical protein MKEN_00855800 [Mycena kentingensis (nom. inval.)]
MTGLPTGRKLHRAAVYALPFLPFIARTSSSRRTCVSTRQKTPVSARVGTLMLDVNDPLVQLKITCATCSFFALGATGYRLYVRRDRLWADDLCALFAALVLIIQIVAVFLHVPIPNNLSRTARVAAYYLMATTFYAIIWASRLSILFSIIRVDPSATRRRRLSYVAYFFVAALTILLAQLLWVCEPTPDWKDAPNPQCPLSLQVAIMQLVTDILADSLLLLAPIPLFRNLSDKLLRRKLTLIFSTCVVTTIVSLVHAAFILQKAGIKVVISALVEDTLSLIVANIPVMVTSLVNLTGDLGSESELRSTSLRFSSMPWYHAQTRNTTFTATTATSYEFESGAITTVHLERLRSPRRSSARQDQDAKSSNHIMSWKDADVKPETTLDLEADEVPDSARSPTKLLPSRSVAFAGQP